MKKRVIILSCALMFLSVPAAFSQKVIEVNNSNSQEGINLNEADITPVKPPAYKNVSSDKYDVRLNNAEYIKELNKRPGRKVDFQLKKPSITPYQGDMSVQ